MRHLLVGNPMLGEMRRERDRALAVHNWKGGQLAARVLLVVSYLFILLLILRYIEYVEPFVLLYGLLGLLTVLLPATLHGAIAGEREKRSLDMLLCAPVTAGQIVVGKFSRAFVTLAGLVLAIGLPAFVIEIVKEMEGGERYGIEGNPMAGFFFAMLLCVSTGLFVGSLTLWISSKMKTGSSAMLATVAALFIVLAVIPALGAVVEPVFPQLSDAATGTNPFVALYYAYSAQEVNVSHSFDFKSVPSAIFVWSSIVVSLGCTVLFLLLASENVWALSKGRKE